jgi:hypothetical protein
MPVIVVVIVIIVVRVCIIGVVVVQMLVVQCGIAVNLFAVRRWLFHVVLPMSPTKILQQGRPLSPQPGPVD